MKTKLQPTAICFFILSFFIFGCGLVSQATETPATPSDTDLLPTATPTRLPVVTSTSTQQPTEAPTSTIYPPVFDPAALGDNRVLLDSFILTKTDKTTGGGGEVEEHKDTIGYIKEPFGGYHLSTTSYGNPAGKYLIGGRFYQKNSTGDWSVSLNLIQPI